MNKASILHKLIKGTDGYESYGVPTVVWDLLVELTKEVYGDEGVAIVTKYHKEFDESVCESFYHSINGWENNGNLNIGPEITIERLKALKHKVQKSPVPMSEIPIGGQFRMGDCTTIHTKTADGEYTSDEGTFVGDEEQVYPV